ncbi:tubulin-tyrosine ligase family protein [Corchorus olitorius]|uniref:Tubulin-tyrosine ligase family protein n=1 Tax=Corchorus olitorius TaxID=93759 RepID=A0A1R3L3R6_9ROSI|nr:tubulin-tyrosine ligase family protein [Corchorus olitorius]
MQVLHYSLVTSNSWMYQLTWDSDPSPQSLKLKHGWIDAIRPLANIYFVYRRLSAPLNPIPYLNLSTHYRVVTEVDQEKGPCPDRLDQMVLRPLAPNETSQGSRMTSLTDHRARKTLTEEKELRTHILAIAI